MKRLVSILFILSFFLNLIGCNKVNQSNVSMIKSPKNSNLKIAGKWECDEYKILDNNIATNEAIFDIFSKDIFIKDSSLQIYDKLYNKIEYRLKIVDSDYSLSYETDFTLKDLGIGNNINVYSVIYENSLLCEIIYQENKESYLYYQGILFTIKYIKDINKSDEVSIDVNNDNSEKFDSSQGLLLGLKVNNHSSINSTTAQYRTLWISMNDGEIGDIKEKKKLILPRRNGFWEVNQDVYEDKNRSIYYEYIIVKSLDTEASLDLQITNVDKLSDNKILKKEINYLTSDYVALEIETNEKFELSPVYSFVPIDNVNTDNSMLITDIYNKKEGALFEEAYNNKLSSLDQEIRINLSRTISYSNFTLLRDKGHWVINGRMSPINRNVEPVDFTLGFKPNKTICNYDILTVPWKILKGEVPLLVDAVTSPDGSLAVILTTEEILVYKIIDGKINNEPSKRIELRDGESVVMTEWCENDYVDKWAAAFNKGSTIVG